MIDDEKKEETTNFGFQGQPHNRKERMNILRERINARTILIRNKMRQNMKNNLGLNDLQQKQFKGFKIR